MNDPVEELMDRLAHYIAPDEADRAALRATWRANPKIMDDFRRRVAEDHDSTPFDVKTTFGNFARILADRM